MTAPYIASAPAADAAGDAPQAARHDIPGLDAIRGLAATGVVATHVAFTTGVTATGAFGAVLARLDYGVALFFGLSGFLLGRPFIAHHAGARRPNVRVYLWRRAVRIMPLYWVVVAVALLALAANRATWSPGDTFGHLLMLQVYGDAALRDGLTQTWSLATEVAFYLILPVLAWALGRVSVRRSAWHPVRALGGLVVLALLAHVVQAWVRAPGSGWPIQAGFWLPYHLDWFAIGLVLAVLHVLVTNRPSPTVASSWVVPTGLDRLAAWLVEGARALGSCWAVAAALFLLAATPLAGPRAFEASLTPWQAVAKSGLYGWSAFFVLLPLVLHPLADDQTRRILASRVGRHFGDLSYGIFLWHLIVLAAIVSVFHVQPFSGGFLALFSATLAGTLVVAEASHRWIERPAQRLRHLVRN